MPEWEFFIAAFISFIFSVVWSCWHGGLLLNPVHNIVVVAVGIFAYLIYRRDRTCIQPKLCFIILVVSTTCVIVIGLQIIQHVTEHHMKECIGQKECHWSQRFRLTGLSVEFIQKACKTFYLHGDIFVIIFVILMIVMVMVCMQPRLGLALCEIQFPSGHYLGPAVKIVAVALMCSYWNLKSERNGFTRKQVHGSFLDGMWESLTTTWSDLPNYEPVWDQFKSNFSLWTANAVWDQFNLTCSLWRANVLLWTETEVPVHLDTLISYWVTRLRDLMITLPPEMMPTITIIAAGPIIWLALALLTLVPNRHHEKQALGIQGFVPVGPCR